MFFHRRMLLAAISRKLCHGLMINFLVIMEKAVFTLGLITLQDQKIKSNNYHLVCVGRLITFSFYFCCNILTGSKNTVA